MAPVRLRSRIAGLLRRAAETLDRSPSPTSPVVPSVARQPGEPPEHWLRLVRDRAPGLLEGEGIGTASPSPAARLGRAADPDSLRWPADPRTTRPAPFPSRSPSSAAPVRPSFSPDPSRASRRSGERVPAEPPVPGRAARVRRPVWVRRSVAVPRPVGVPEPERQEPLAVPEFPVDRRARVVLPRFPVERRGRSVVPEFPVDSRQPLTAPDFRAEETVAVDAPEFPADASASPADVAASRTVAARAFPVGWRGTAVRPGYPTDPAPVAPARADWSSPAPARVVAAPEWPRLPEPHGRREPVWPHPDPDPSRWPALPDDSPLWTVPGSAVDERHVRRLDEEQAGR